MKDKIVFMEYVYSVYACNNTRFSYIVIANARYGLSRILDLDSVIDLHIAGEPSICMAIDILATCITKVWYLPYTINTAMSAFNCLQQFNVYRRL